MAGRRERALRTPAGIATASALALTLLTACGPKAAPQAEASPAPPPPAAARPVLSSSLDQIQNQYAADAAAARGKYQKVAVQFTALADTVDAPPGQDLVIGFHTAQHPQPIRAVFPKAAADGHAPVKSGDMVMTRCDQVVEVAGKPELHDCAFR
jgi:hypothetical protein